MTRPERRDPSSPASVPGLRAAPPLGALLLATLLAAPSAEAQKRAVLLPFSGAGGPAIQQSLQDALRADARVRVQPADELFSMASELGIDARRLEKDPTLLSQAASASQVDAVIKGSVQGQKLTLHVHDGGTGNELRRLDIGLTRGKLAGAELQRTVNRLIPAIEGGQWMGQLPPELPLLPPGEVDESGGPPISIRPAASPAVAPQRPPQPPRVRAAEPLPEPPRRPEPPPRRTPEPAPLLAEPSARPGEARPAAGVRPRPERLGVDDDEDEVFDEPGTEAWPGGGGGGGPALTDRAPLALTGGATFLARTYELQGVRLADGRKGGVDYRSGYFPGLLLQGEVYPLLLMGEPGWPSGLGLAASFEYGFLKSEVQEQVNDKGELQRVDRMEPTTQYVLAADAVYRILPFTLGAGDAAVELHAGLGMTRFALETGTPGYKSSTTVGLRTGAELDVPFYAASGIVLGASGGGAYLIGSTSLNDKARYPASPARGFDLQGSLWLTYGQALLVRAGYFYQGISTEYAATGSDPAATSNDRYQGFQLLLGYGG